MNTLKKLTLALLLALMTLAGCSQLGSYPMKMQNQEEAKEETKNDENDKEDTPFSSFEEWKYGGVFFDYTIGVSPKRRFMSVTINNEKKELLLNDGSSLILNAKKEFGGDRSKIFLGKMDNGSKKVLCKFLEREADKEADVFKAIEQKGGHPNIVEAYGCITDNNGAKCIVREYVDGDQPLTLSSEEEKALDNAIKFLEGLGDFSFDKEDLKNPYNRVHTENGIKLIDLSTKL